MKHRTVRAEAKLNSAYKIKILLKSMIEHTSNIIASIPRRIRRRERQGRGYDFKPVAVVETTWQKVAEAIKDIAKYEDCCGVDGSTYRYRKRHTKHD